METALPRWRPDHSRAACAAARCGMACACRDGGRLPQFVDNRCKRRTEPREAVVLLEVRAHVTQRPWNVLDVDRIPARCRLIPERAQCLQVALHGHQIETAAEFGG